MKAGKITEVQCKRSVLKQIPSNAERLIQGPGIGNDYAAWTGRTGTRLVTAMSTISFDTAEAEKYAFWKAVNKLETSGAVTRAVMVNLMLPARGGEERIRRIVEHIAELCEIYDEECPISYAGGHTELLEELRAPMITVIAYGELEGNEEVWSIRRVQPGDQIVMIGTTALETTAMLTADHLEELNQRYATGYLDLARAISEDLSLHKAFKVCRAFPVKYIHDISTGGVFAALWELGEGADCGLKVRLKDIPIRQETVEVCEFFDLNPYMALGGGSALIVTENGEELVDILEQAGISATLIGQTADNNDRIIINEEDARYLTPPKGDDIYKIYRN